MKHKSSLILLFFALLAPFSSSVKASPTGKRPSLGFIVGKWRVTSDNPSDIKNHTYEFLPDGTSVEKYRSEQMAGPVDEPPQSVWMNTVKYYRYEFLGKNRYKLEETKSLVNGEDPSWARESHLIEATITQNKAKVTVVSRQIIGDEEMLAQLDKMLRDVSPGKANKQKVEVATWVKIPPNFKKVKINSEALAG